jgi:hypothetical protein
MRISQRAAWFSDNHVKIVMKLKIDRSRNISGSERHKNKSKRKTLNVATAKLCVKKTRQVLMLCQ